MRAHTKAWVDCALGLQVPNPDALTIPYEDYREALEIFCEPDWQFVTRHDDPGGSLTGRSERYNQPRTTVTLMSRSSAPDGKFLRVKVRYGKNGPSNMAWLFCKKVE
jgi:hypothetical protein